MNSRGKKIKYCIKQWLKFSIIAYLLFPSQLSASRVYTIVNDLPPPCFRGCQVIGLYAGLNVGYTWFNLALHRPEANDVLPILANNFVKESSSSFIATLGYDFFPCTKTPVRIEVNYLYADVGYRLDPLFQSGFQEPFFTDDRFLVRNTMGTLYFDWHNCTAFRPYVGISGGVANLKTYHHPDRANLPLPFVYKTTESNFSWGATIGSRYFITNYLFANLQLRYNNLGEVIFRNFDESEILAPNHIAYQSDYLHETTILAGIGYVF